MNAIVAISCVAMALLTAISSIEIFIAIGLVFAVIAAIFIGPLKGLAVIAPLFLYEAGPELITPAYAAIGILFIFDEKEPQPLTEMAWSAGAILAGLSFASLMVLDGGSFDLYWSIGVCLATALVMAAVRGVRMPSLLPTSIQSHIIILFLYGFSELRWNWLIYGESFLVGLIICAMLGVVAYKEEKIDIAGAIAGVIMGTVIFVSLGGAGFVLMFFFIMLAVVATSISAHSHGEPKEYEMRGAGNAFANLGPATLFALFSLMAYDPAVFNIAFCASLSAALSDTVSSELGRGSKSGPVDILSWRRVEAGSDGAISMTGSSLGVLAALFIGSVSATIELVSVSGAVAVVIGGVAGNLTDSLLGSRFENRGLLSNDQVNAWSVFAGGVIAAFIGLVII